MNRRVVGNNNIMHPSIRKMLAYNLRVKQRYQIYNYTYDAGYEIHKRWVMKFTQRRPEIIMINSYYASAE